MRCPRCQHENPDVANFCGRCGAPLALVVCPSCGRENPRTNAFCFECGARLPATPDPAAADRASERPAGAGAPSRPAPERRLRDYTPKHLVDRILRSKAALEGERKNVTVLFADLKGSTSIAAGLDPEEMHALMDRCFQPMLEEIHRFEGTVNQFTGDGLMALFGAPLAVEDAPRRAVLAALGIQRALEPLRQDAEARLGVDVRMRIGINSGLVVVGRIGDDLRMDYTAVGTTTNLAARLESLAPPGGVLISEATARLVSDFFELRDAGLHEVKGSPDPLHVFEVASERPVRGRLEAVAETELTPLVGRARELEALSAAYSAACEGHGQVVFVVGDAGIGKSRLLLELRRRLGDKPHQWFEGRCTSYGRDTAFGPIIDGYRRGFGIEERDDDATALARIEARERALGGDLTWTLPYVRQLLSLPPGDPALAVMDAATRRSETFRAIRARFLRAAERQPLVLVIEDLHWIDAASEELLSFLADSVPATQTLACFTHRPGYVHPFGDRSYHVRVALQALSKSETVELTRAALHTAELPPDLRRLVAQKADGNPFFVEEATRSLIEEGTLRLVEGRAELARELADTSVPDRIQDVLMARLDRLPDEPKRAIQIAAVIGREFALRLLERISEAGERVRTVVEELRALELIYEKSAHPELAYMFKHAYTRDVAYESVLKARRTALHRVVGAAIEELYRDRLAEHYEALAHHFGQGEEWERALHYHERAADKAAEAYANQSAAEHCRRGLEICERLGEAVPDERRRALAERLGMVCWLTSDFPASGDAYLLAARFSPTPALQAANLARGAFSLEWAHEYARARAAGREALRLAREHGPPSELARGRMVALYDQLLREGMDGVVPTELPSLLEGAAGDPEVLAHLEHVAGQAVEWMGDYPRAIALQESALRAGRRLRRPDLIIQSIWFLGKAYCCRGDYTRALSLLREALAVAERLGDRAWRTRLFNTLGWCYGEIGAYDSSAECNHRSVALAKELERLGLVAGVPELMGNASANLGLSLLAQGDAPAAEDAVAAAWDELAKPGDPWMRWRYGLHLSNTLGCVALARGQLAQALALADEQLAGARRHLARKLEARALELRARALLAQDRGHDAEENARAALALAEEIGYPPVCWRAHAVLALRARRAGQSDTAGRHEAALRSRIEALAQRLEEEPLRRSLRGLADVLATDPLAPDPH